MNIPPIFFYILLLLAITYFKSEQLALFNNIIGKIILIAFVCASAYNYGIPTGVVSSLICVMVLHTSYEGFYTEEKVQDDKETAQDNEENTQDEK
jgi:predicted membrane protein